MKARKLVVSAVLALALAGPASVLAGDVEDPGIQKVKVSFADLNINHVAGAKVLYRRLQQASADVCSVDTFQKLGSLERLAKTQHCYEITLDQAVAEIDSVVLKEIHAS